MAERDALGAAGRAAGVEQGGEVVVAPVDQGQLVAGLEVGEGVRAALAHDHDRQAGGRRLHLGQELRGRDDGLGARVGHDVAQLVLGEQEQHRGRHGAGPPQRGVGDADLGAVGHDDDDPVARARRRGRRSRARRAGPARPARPSGASGPRTTGCRCRRGARAPPRRGGPSAVMPAGPRRGRPPSTRLSSTVAVSPTTTRPSSSFSSTVPVTSSVAPASSSGTTTGRLKRTR